MFSPVLHAVAGPCHGGNGRCRSGVVVLSSGVLGQMASASTSSPRPGELAGFSS